MNERRRRVVYLTDEEWAQLGRMGADQGTNRSEAIRGLLTETLVTDEDDLPGLGRAVVPRRPKPKSGGPSSAVMEPVPDIDLSQLKAPEPTVRGGFNTRPFTPAPKTRKS